MQAESIEFVEDSEYAYAVGRIRALETRRIDSATLNSLISAPEARFLPLFVESTGLGGGDIGNSSILSNLEESYSETFAMIRAMIIEEEMRRLISLKYDYELLKLILKEERKSGEVVIPMAFQERSNYGYQHLKSALTEGRATETGEMLFGTYRHMSGLRESSGRDIDIACDIAYHTELFVLLDRCRNPFIKNYFIRSIDAKNIVTVLRIKSQGKKRSELRGRLIPFGSIDQAYFEEGFDLNIDGFAGIIIFSPLASILSQVDKSEDEGDQIAWIERSVDEHLLQYLRESVFVTFGIEPLLAFLWEKEIENKNLRTILIARLSGVPTHIIKKQIRGLYGS